MENDIYILNPGYGIKSDIRRILLYKKDTNPIERDDLTDFLGFVHPIYAILFSIFDGEKNLKEVISEFSNITELKKENVVNIIEPLIENKDILKINYESYHFSFPKNILVKKKGIQNPIKYPVEDFFIPKKMLDLTTWRLYSPLDLQLMINTSCVTDCIYCYADRRKRMDCQIPIYKLKELVKEAKELGMRSFDITGGELFLYEYWEDLLRELVSFEFNPYISTKIPLNIETIKKIKDLGIKRIQISIDSIYKEELMSILNVGEDYFDKLMKTIENLDKNGFSIYTNSQMTKINQNNFENLIEFLLNLENIERINIGVAGFSLYKDENAYIKIRPELRFVKKIEEYIDKKKNNIGNRKKLSISGYAEKIENDMDKRTKAFNERARCSGNFFAFFILPDGKVTVCEELYWHPKFILGDLLVQSIEELWNSDRAIGLYNLSKDMIRDESACKSCEQFDVCRKYEGVCWKEIFYAYGEENWDYPDPKCPKAPNSKRIIWIE